MENPIQNPIQKLTERLAALKEKSHNYFKEVVEKEASFPKIVRLATEIAIEDELHKEVVSLLESLEEMSNTDVFASTSVALRISESGRKLDSLRESLVEHRRQALKKI